jgi:hypothetical protein
MAITFSCGSCGKKFAAKDEDAGRRSKFPACGWEIVVPCVWTREPDVSAATPPIPRAALQPRTDPKSGNPPQPARAPMPAVAARVVPHRSPPPLAPLPVTRQRPWCGERIPLATRPCPACREDPFIGPQVRASLEEFKKYAWIPGAGH